jgi:hypothetical protein
MSINKSRTSQREKNEERLAGQSAYTHEDVLYEAYCIAFLVLSSMKAPSNPGNPYNGSPSQNGFATMGGPDIASTLAAVAGAAIRSVWY